MIGLYRSPMLAFAAQFEPRPTDYPECCDPTWGDTLTPNRWEAREELFLSLLPAPARVVCHNQVAR